MIITKVGKTQRARLTSQGQITVPKAVRDELRAKTGDELEFVRHVDGFLIRHRPRVSVLDFAGIGSAAASHIPTTAEGLDALLEAGRTEEARKRDAALRTASGAPPRRRGRSA